MHPRLGTAVLERQYRHFRPSAFLFFLVAGGSGALQLDQPRSIATAKSGSGYT